MKLRYAMDVEVGKMLHEHKCGVLWDESFPHAVELQFENGDSSVSWIIDSDLLCTFTISDRNVWGDVSSVAINDGYTYLNFTGNNEDTGDIDTQLVAFKSSDLDNIKKMIDADVLRCEANSSALELTPFHRYIDEGLKSLLV